ncbi:MAG TPA: Ppx/GppA phosphatase family protein [Xanthobacteraceae bacterium]|jgi:exopolyphosphatase/guanosine-5'-triphosphate,3'-diphosphate pyrophosphatase
MPDDRADRASGPPSAPRAKTRRRRRNRGPWRRPSGPGGGDAPPVQSYAALDLGTNNCRLLVARPTYDAFRVVDSFSRIVRLGEGLSSSGRLSDAAMNRAIGALRVCAGKLRYHGKVRSRLIATEACRAAENGDEFLGRVRTATGLALEIIDRETEARLAAHGCASLLDAEASGAILFDIGGGSSELAFLGRCAAVDHGPPLAAIQSWVSLPVGVVTLAERYGGREVSPATFAAMVAEVHPLVQEFAARANAPVMNGLHLLGTSGTVTTMAGLHLNLPRYDRRQVDGLWMEASELDAVVEHLLTTSYEERVLNACIGAERADLVLGGCAILEAIRRVFPCERLRVADRGLREGMLVELMRADGAWSPGNTV